ncbi:PREDICTED: uncharacterized protein LOC107194406 [Dufourea novaeangliae]|uniref:Uncharacterized protein n=1 Tax=Dufourea novaeangliae TaxID=178035 RepID=A0A154P2C4_DUFNO|nr:PREDICTED: uncharacterized protein LOC107194406 [Dufourea novaeangliae]KZC06089.1 hypothetical protein WN55_07175 [Dufourea novaeangliae]
MNVIERRTVILFLALLGAGPIQGSSSEKHREKRQLLYPPPLVYPFGGNFKLIVGLAVPVQLSGRILVYGQNIQFQYALPDNATFFTNIFEGSSRRRRNAYWNERTPVYDILERELDRRNIDGKSCLKKDICETAATPLKDEGLLGELLHLLLTPDHGGAPRMDQEYLEAAAAGRRHENCSMIYSACPAGLGILDRISTIH